MDNPGLVTPNPSSGFFSLPSSGLGKWSAWLLVASLVLVLINNLAVMPWTEQTGGLDLAQSAVNLTVVACIAAAGLTGLVAVISKHERSAAVFSSILLLAFALAMNIGSLL
jgi:hypothetical protein